MSFKSYTAFTVEAPTNGRSVSSMSELSPGDFSDSDCEGDQEVPSAIRIHGITGRDEEISQLRRAFDRVSNNNNIQHAAGDDTGSSSSEVVFLQGEPGSGKTCLVDFALREYASSRGGYFCYGKFDKVWANVPFSAIVQAFADLIDLISAQGDTKQNREDIFKVLSQEDVKILSKLMSNISYIVGSEQRVGVTTKDRLKEERLNHNVSVVRLKLIFAALLRVLSSARNPVVLVLDDLQWSDHASREVIRALLTDVNSKHVLITCIHRKGDFQETVNVVSLKVTELSVHHLGLDDLNEMLATLTKMDPRECIVLSEIVLSKTLGNPYHAVQFLEMLIRCKRMLKSETTGEWTWDIDKIVAETNVSDNVAALLERKIKDLPIRLQLILQVAAHLGFCFEVAVLETVLFETIDKQGEDPFANDDKVSAAGIRQVHREKIEKKLQNAVNLGLIELSGDNSYKFCHDRVQEAIREMVPVGKERQTMQAKLGSQLYKMARAGHDEKILFLAADQLNEGEKELSIPKQRVKLVQLNMEASNVALSKAALMMARRYLKKGISLIDESTLWSENYLLALDLYSSLAELGDSAKDVGKSEDAVNMVLKHAVNDLDKMRVHHATIERFISSSQFNEALETGCTVLTSLGYRFPEKPGVGSVLYELVQVKKMLRGKSDASFLALPVTQDETLIHAMHILQSMASACYFSGVQHKFSYALATLRNLKLSYQKGLSNYSVDAFSGYAIMASMQGDFDTANRFGRLAIGISKKLNAKGMEARSSSGLYHLVFPWKLPLKECIAGFRFSFRQGMATSETNIAFAAGMGAITLMHHTGSPLWETEERMRLIVAQMKEYRQTEMCRNSLPFYQVILNIKDQSDEPSSLKGDAIDLAIGLAGYTLNQDHAFKMEFAASFSLAHYFEDWSKLEYLLQLYGGKQRPVKAHFSYFLTTFSAGMAYFELFRIRQKQAYRKRARKKLRQMQQWLNGGNVNCLPMLSILQAEALSITSSAKHKDVLALYDKGALEASALSFVQIEATAYERAACYLFLEGEKRREYLAKSINLYHMWGADGKVAFLEKKHTIRLKDVVQASRRTLASSVFSSRDLDPYPKNIYYV